MSRLLVHNSDFFELKERTEQIFTKNQEKNSPNILILKKLKTSKRAYIHILWENIHKPVHEPINVSFVHESRNKHN